MDGTHLVNKRFTVSDIDDETVYTITSTFVNHDGNDACTVEAADIKVPYNCEEVTKYLATGKWVEVKTVKLTNTSVSILTDAAECIGDRAAERDTKNERSMASCVAAFNGMYNTHLTEEQGWMFMVLLKMSRAKGGAYKRDDFVDGAAYFALAGECRNDK